MRARSVPVLAAALLSLVAPALLASPAHASGVAPDVPTDRATGSVTACVTGAARPSVAQPPVLYARGSDPDGGLLVLTFEWWRPGGARVGSATTSFQGSGSVFAAQVPSAAFADGDDIAWRVRADDGTLTSAWTSFCEVHLDLTPPGDPRVSVERAPVVQGDRARLRFSAAPGSGTVVYRWSVGGVPQPDCVPSASDGDCQVAVDATSTSTVVQVRAVDPASNISDVVSTVLSAKPSSFLVADWRSDFAHPGRWTSLVQPRLVLRPSESAASTRVLGARTLVDTNDGPRPRLTPAGARVLRFDGVNDLTSVPGTPVDTTQGVTIAVTSSTRSPYGGPQTVAAVAGTEVALLTIGYDGRGGVAATVRTADDPTAGTVVAEAGPGRLAQTCGAAVDLSLDHELGAALDARLGQLRLYVDSCLVARVPVGAPWAAAGPLVVGTGWSDGAPSADAFAGTVSGVSLRQGGAFPAF